MPETAKAIISNRVRQEGHTGSYGALLYLVALMGADPKALNPRTEHELVEWGGHFEGLRAALHCLVMYEKHVGPEPAAKIVGSHIAEAIADVDRCGDTGTGG